MPTSLIVQIELAFAVCSVLFAMWKGGAAERLAAGAVGANIVIGMMIFVFLDGERELFPFALDGLTALALLAITLRYGTVWMGVMMLLYSGQFALHAYYLSMARDPRDYLHALLNNINFTAIVLCLVIGTAVTWRRRMTLARTRIDPAT